MKLGIVLMRSDAETAWNALRLANLALKNGDEVRVFLTGAGVEYEKNADAPFDAKSEGSAFVKAGGKIYACGSCLDHRNQNPSASCPLGRLTDLYDILKTSDKVISY